MNKSLDFDSIWPHVTCSIFLQTKFTVKYFCVFFDRKLENDPANPLESLFVEVFNLMSKYLCLGAIRLIFVCVFLVTCEESNEIISLNPERS